MEIDLRAQQASRHPLDNTPFPDRDCVEPRSIREKPSPLERVAAEQSDRVFAHQHTEVVLGLGEQAIGVDELEAILGLEGVPFVDIAVDEDSPLVIVGGNTPRRAGERMVERCFRAGAIETPPMWW